jgi:ribosome-associated heat shock protein Hsp15
MRIDKFLNSINLTKRRSIAQDMIDNGVVSINDKIVKASKNVAVGDIISLAYLNGIKKYQVLLLPEVKSTPKSEQEKYIKELA